MQWILLIQFLESELDGYQAIIWVASSPDFLYSRPLQYEQIVENPCFENVSEAYVGAFQTKSTS